MWLARDGQGGGPSRQDVWGGHCDGHGGGHEGNLHYYMCFKFAAQDCRQMQAFLVAQG